MKNTLENVAVNQIRLTYSSSMHLKNQRGFNNYQIWTQKYQFFEIILFTTGGCQMIVQVFFFCYLLHIFKRKPLRLFVDQFTGRETLGFFSVTFSLLKVFHHGTNWRLFDLAKISLVKVDQKGSSLLTTFSSKCLKLSV